MERAHQIATAATVAAVDVPRTNVSLPQGPELPGGVAAPDDDVGTACAGAAPAQISLGGSATGRINTMGGWHARSHRRCRIFARLWSGAESRRRPGGAGHDRRPRRGADPGRPG